MIHFEIVAAIGGMGRVYNKVCYAESRAEALNESLKAMQDAVSHILKSQPNLNNFTIRVQEIEPKLEEAKWMEMPHD